MAWLSGWDQRIKATVDSAVVDADLTQFPVTLIGGTSVGKTSADISAIFDEVGSNWEKIAVTQTDGETELYVEKELWDSVGEKFVLHCSKPGWVLDGDADSDLYIYYDNDHADNTTYVGAINSTPGAAVWDANHLGVWHMADATTSTVKDSTSNNKDGTKKGANEPIVAAAKVGNGQDFDGSNDYITFGTGLGLSGAGTIEWWLYYQNAGSAGDRLMIVKRDGSGTNYQLSVLAAPSGGASHIGWYDGTNPDVLTYTPTANTWTRLIFVRTGTTEFKLYVNGAYSETLASDWGAGTSAELTMGGSVPVGGFYCDCVLDEVRISNVVRSAAWIKADYYNQTDALLTWGSEERVWAAIAGVTYANVARVAGVAKADIATIAGVA